MFTGIVEEIGTISRWIKGAEVCQLKVDCTAVLEGTKLGDSIGVNGVCLTVAQLGRDHFTADIMVESLAKTALGTLKTGEQVNLERALQIGARLGGHWVTGHIDGVGTITTIRREKNSLLYQITLPEEVSKISVPMGSIAIDGTSLTIARLTGNDCVVSLIPHTASKTILGQKKSGDLVNVEADILGKYVAKNLQKSEVPSAELTLDKLKGYGYA